MTRGPIIPWKNLHYLVEYELTYDNELELNSTFNLATNCQYEVWYHCFLLTDVDPVIGVTLLIVVNNLN